MLNVYIFFRSMFSQIMPMTHSVHFVYDFIDFVVVDLMFQKKKFFYDKNYNFFGQDEFKYKYNFKNTPYMFNAIQQ